MFARSTTSGSQAAFDDGSDAFGQYCSHHDIFGAGMTGAVEEYLAAGHVLAVAVM